jgi:hypothetical protein
MVGNQEGIGTLKLECPQMHSVGRLLKDAPYQSVVFDPGAQVGVTTALQERHRDVINSASETTEVVTLPYV